MPRLTRRTPPAKRHAKADAAHAPQFSAQGEPLVGPHHKQALIQAHAHVRHKVRAGWGWGYYIGVTATCLVVVSGWWLTLDKNLRTNMSPGRDPLVQVIDDSAQNMRDNMQAASQSPTGTQALLNNVEQLRQEYARARAQAEASNTHANDATSTIPSHPTSTP